MKISFLTLSKTFNIYKIIGLLALIGMCFTANVFASSLDEKALWQPYSAILNKTIIPIRFNGPVGEFYHHGVRYSAIKADKHLQVLFNSQNAILRKVDVKKLDGQSVNYRLAFWVNAYNYFTLVAVVERLPVKSMKEIGWKQKKWQVGNKKYNLDDIEHKIIRPIGDARIHFAINCASVSCPSLYTKPFTEANYQKTATMLTENALKNPLNLRLTKGGKLVGTEIFSWFKKDFNQAPYASVDAFIKKHAPPVLSAKKISKNIKYDWKLNTAKNLKKALKKLDVKVK